MSTINLLKDVFNFNYLFFNFKEANQSGQSIHYDVELLHPKIAHSALKNSGLLEENNSKLLDNVTVHWNLFNSVRLKWCTAKALKNEIVKIF